MRQIIIKHIELLCGCMVICVTVGMHMFLFRNRHQALFRSGSFNAIH